MNRQVTTHSKRPVRPSSVVRRQTENQGEASAEGTHPTSHPFQAIALIVIYCAILALGWVFLG